MSRAWVHLIPVALLVATGVTGYIQGHKAATTAAEAEQAKHLRNAFAQAEALAAQDREIITAGDARVARIQRVFQTIDREVIRYVQTHPLAADCLDADGLQLWTAANAGAVPPGASDGAQPGPLPGDAAGAKGRDGAGPAGGPRGAGAAVSQPARGGRDVGRLDVGQPPHWGWQ